MDRSDYVEIEACIYAVTDEAVLVEAWVPRSVIDTSSIDIDSHVVGREAVFGVERWFIEKEGLDYLAV